LNVGITPTFDFRTGATATVVPRFTGDLGGQITQVSAVVPAMLRVDWSPWFSSAAGHALRPREQGFLCVGRLHVSLPRWTTEDRAAHLSDQEFA
jgi:hypothetical protein